MTLDVVAFSEANFYAALQSPKQTRAQVESHDQAKYLFGYLNHLSAQTIVVEHDYTDGDYLDDFANYYVKSFESYDRRCKRLHFFNTLLDEPTLRSILTVVAAASTLQPAYLGFIVARPLPSAIVGRTVLVTYPPDSGRRRYPSTREYKAHLFGTPLRIESLAFQEQDTVLAACATVALWSAFHKTSQLFGTALPTPAEITRSATAGIFSSRPLPSRGLNPSQMARAVRDVGLEPEVFQYTSDLPLLSLLIGYSALGIPPILGIDIEGQGLHALTVTGYSLQSSTVHTLEDAVATSLPMPLKRIGLRMDELYVHDDGHGPFAKITVCINTAAGPGDALIEFEGTWKDPQSGRLLRLTPKFVLVPVYHKIRLTFMDVQRWVTEFALLLALTVSDPENYEWEVLLETTNDFKERLKGSALSSTQIQAVLFKQQPRYLWSATLSFQGQVYVQLLFDATGMARSFPIHEILFHDPAFQAAIRTVAATPALAGLVDENFLQRLRTS